MHKTDTYVNAIKNCPGTHFGVLHCDFLVELKPSVVLPAGHSIQRRSCPLLRYVPIEQGVHVPAFVNCSPSKLNYLIKFKCIALKKCFYCLL